MKRKFRTSFHDERAQREDEHFWFGRPFVEGRLKAARGSGLITPTASGHNQQKREAKL